MAISNARAKRLRLARNEQMAEWLWDHGHAYARARARKEWPGMQQRHIEDILADAKTRVCNRLRALTDKTHE